MWNWSTEGRKRQGKLRLNGRKAVDEDLRKVSWGIGVELVTGREQWEGFCLALHLEQDGSSE